MCGIFSSLLCFLPHQNLKLRTCFGLILRSHLLKNASKVSAIVEFSSFFKCTLWKIKHFSILDHYGMNKLCIMQFHSLTLQLTFINHGECSSIPSRTATLFQEHFIIYRLSRVSALLCVEERESLTTEHVNGN